MTEIIIPHNYQPRNYQLPLLQALDSGILRAVAVWHRRSGKDKTGLNFTIKRMFERKGIYYYFLPTYAQGKKIIWDGMDKDGFPFLSHFPKEIIEKKNDSEMKIVVRNGSLFQVVGTDNINSIVGTNPVGCVFSEYSLQNPVAWDYIRPILNENGGWALFLYTPRGKNHGWTLYEMARQNPNWFCEKLTINETKAITPESIERERQEGMDEDLVQQEYFCSFEGALQGSYYSKQLRKAEEDNRIGITPYDERLKVNTAWDLGIGDATAIWFFQQFGTEVRLIDYYENSGEGLHHYISYLDEKRQKQGYLYGLHYAPHDIEVRELGTGKSRKEVAASLGVNFQVVPNLPIEEGIDTTRRVLRRCWFDKAKCEKGLNALWNYHKEYDEERKTFKSKPEHDWSEHGASAFRYLALSVRDYGTGKIIEIQEPFNPYKMFPEI